MKIAAYCRVSTDKEEQRSSLIHQKEFFLEYARRNGHELYRLYTDEGITGTSLKKRDAFNRLMADARCGFFQSVVVKDISRLARNTVDFLVSIRQLKAMGINVIFLNANMDSMGDSEFILTLFSAMAQEESSNLSKRTKFGKRLNAEKGRVPRTLFGYDRLDNFTLAINPEEARTVRKIFSLYSDQGFGCRTVSLTLNRDGDKTKSGGEWNPRGVRRILVNPIYKGTLVNHKYEIEDFLTGKQISLPQEEQFFHDRPEWAIVSPEVFQKAQQIMESRRIRYDSGEPCREARYSGRHIFSTLIRCAHCGRSFTRKTYTYANTRVYWKCITNDQYTARRCGNRVCVEEGALLEQLRGYLASRIGDEDAFAADILARLDRQLPPPQDPELLKKDIAANRKKLLSKKDRYQQMYLNDIITIKELKTKVTSIEEALNRLDTELEELAPSGEVSNSSEDRIRRCKEEIHRFLKLETVTNGDMRRILDYISVDQEGNVRFFLKKLDDRA